MWIVWLAACMGAPEPEAAAVGVAGAAPVELTEVRLPMAVLVGGKITREPEFRGLITAALELGLADIPGVMALVPGDGTPMAYRGGRPPPSRQVDAVVSVRGLSEGAFSLELELCVAGGECSSTTAEATTEAPWPAVGAVLAGAALGLGVEVPEPTLAAWNQPGSKDSYSEMMTGRAAASFYGILPPSLSPGDRRLDPVVRAVFLDPGQPLAQWMRARWEVASAPDGGKAGEALAKAQMQRPTSPLLAADQAAMLSLTGHPAEALSAWETLVASAPDDPRWWLPLARARLAAGRAEEAHAALEALPVSYAWDPAVAALRVAAAEAVGKAEILDPLLARWQAVDSANPEPVRRRIEARVRAAAYAEAQQLIGVLRDRVPGPATDALEVALLVALGRFDDAAALAPPELAVRIRARARLELIAGEVPADLPASDPLYSLVVAGVALHRNEPAAALAAAERTVAASPRLAAAQVLRARALEASGRGSEAADAWVRAWDLDPAAQGGPVESGRIASTFQYVEAGEHPADALPFTVPGPAGPEL